MPTNVNIAAISGNLTRDAELRMTQGGTAVLGFSVAVNDSARDQQTGQWEDKANYIDCVMFGQRAQSIAHYLRKGSFVAVQGSLSWSQWQDRETGKNRSKVELRVREINFPQQMQPHAAAQPAPQPAPQAYQPPQQAYQPAYQQQPAPQAYQQPAPQPAAQPAPQPAPQAVQQPAPHAPQQVAPTVEVYDEDIPF